MRSFVIYETLEAAKKGQLKLEEYYPKYKWIRFITDDGYLFDVVTLLFYKSTVICNMLEGLDVRTEFEGIRSRSSVPSIVINDMPITLNFDGRPFEAILEGLDCLKNEEHPDLSECNLDMLIAMLKIADYFDIQELILTIIKEIDIRMSGNTPDQVRETFNISNDFKKEEHDQIVNEGLWSFNVRL